MVGSPWALREDGRAALATGGLVAMQGRPHCGDLQSLPLAKGRTCGRGARPVALIVRLEHALDRLSAVVPCITHRVSQRGSISRLKPLTLVLHWKESAP